MNTIEDIITAKRKAYFSGTILLETLLREAIQEGRDDVLQSLQAVEAARDGYRELSEGQSAVIKDKKAKIAELEESLKSVTLENVKNAADALRLTTDNHALNDAVTGLKKEITKLRSAKRKP